MIGTDVLSKCMATEKIAELIEEKLKELNVPKVAFIGQRASDMLIFNNIIKIDLVVCLDYGKDAQVMERSVPIISLEKEGGVRKEWYSRQLRQIFESAVLSEQIKKALPKGSLLLPYAADVAIEEFAKANDYLVLAPPSGVKSFLESKLIVSKIKDELALPNKSIVLSSQSPISFDDLTVKFGTTKFVVQSPNGSSGSGTFFVSDESEFDAVLKGLLQEQGVLVTPFVCGPTISINAVVTKNQTVAYAPSVQVVNQPELAPKNGVFSGVDFNAAKSLSKEELSGLRRLVSKVGERMREMGFKGLCNFNVMKEGLLLTDINPRCMGSGQLMSAMQQRDGNISFAALHVAALLGIDVVVGDDCLETLFLQKKGAFLVMHSLERSEAFVGGDIALEIDVDRLIANDVLGAEPLVSGSVPQRGKRVMPGAPLLRVFLEDEVLDKDYELAIGAKRLIEETYAKLNLKK